MFDLTHSICLIGCQRHYLLSNCHAVSSTFSVSEVVPTIDQFFGNLYLIDRTLDLWGIINVYLDSPLTVKSNHHKQGTFDPSRNIHDYDC